jgi:diguanylate cyclase (GGDEF)-like protein/PAS domain S-box-containing protein
MATNYLLLVEHSPAEARHMQGLLNSFAAPGSMPLRWVQTARAAAHMLHQDPNCEAVLLSLNLPEAPGLEALHLLRRNAQYPPVITITDVDNDSLGLQAIEAGAQAYLVTSRTGGGELQRALAQAVWQKQRAADMATLIAAMRDLYDNAPCAFHSLNAEGVFLHVNATELNWLGCTREELVGKKSIRDFLTAEGLEVFRKNFPRIAQEGRVDGIEFELVSKTGQRRHVTITANAVRDAQGDLLMTRTVMLDITELHQARHQLRQAAQAQNAMLNNDLIGIVKLKDRQAVWVNNAMHRIFGYEPGELLGRPSSMLYPTPQASAEFGARAYAALKTSQAFREQVQMVRKDGTPLWIDANGTSHNEGEFLWMLADITPIKQSQAHVEHIAFHDALTGLPNRWLLTDRLQQSLRDAKRQGLMLAVCYLDLDGFKPVNDQHGHDAGDALLIEVAQRLRKCVRDNDTVCRTGGDEFVLLLPGLAKTEECDLIVHRVVAAVAQAFHLPCVTPNSTTATVKVTVSVGVACFPNHAQDPQSLLSHADRAMYSAKQKGLGQIVWHAN